MSERPVYVRPRSGRKPIPVLRGPAQAAVLALASGALGVLALAVAGVLVLPGSA